MIFLCAQNLIPQKGFGLPRIGINVFLPGELSANHSRINHNKRAVKLVSSDTATLTDVLIPNT